MANQSKQSMPGHQPLSLSTDEPASFAAPGFAAAGKSLDSSSYVAESVTIPKTLPPRASGAPAPIARVPAASAPTPAPAPQTPAASAPNSIQLAEQLVLHALRLLETPLDKLSPMDVSLAKCASLVLEHVQDHLQGLLKRPKVRKTSTSEKKRASRKRSNK